MSLTVKLKQQLKAQAHALKPVILIGQHGLTEAVRLETDQALQAHELIKIRVMSEDRAERQEIFTEICRALNAELVQVIGKIGIVYRKNPN